MFIDIYVFLAKKLNSLNCVKSFKFYIQFKNIQNVFTKRF